jgi:hypothetical protein
MSAKTLLRSFAGGEITPELYGRLDLTKYQTGLSKSLNFRVLPHGPAARRPGFRFVNEAKASNTKVRLIPFAYSAEQTVLLEFGHLYIRFHVDGSTLLESTVAITSVVGNVVTTTAAHGYSTGDWVYLSSLSGTPARYFKITVTGANTFTTQDYWGANANPGLANYTSARVYTVTTTYTETDLFDLHYAQDSDIMTICHPSYPAKELRRYGAQDWQLTNVSFAPVQPVPAAPTVTATIAQNLNLSPQVYAVTSVAADGVSESLISTTTTVSNNLTLAGNYNTIIFNPVDGGARYNIYKKRGGIFGYIGQIRPQAATSKTITNIVAPGTPGRLAITSTVRVTTSTAHGFSTSDIITVTGSSYPLFNGTWLINVINSTQFEYSLGGSVVLIGLTSTGGTASTSTLSILDDNITPDTVRTPPEDIVYLNTVATDYPRAVTHYEQRRWFGGTDSKQQGIWATRNGTLSNLTSSVPTREDDAIEFRIAAQQQNAIRHLIPLSDMVALTVGGEFRIFADNAPNITPTSLSIKPQGYTGASNVQPALTSGSILYVQSQGSRIREFSYNAAGNNYVSIDISIMAPHLFNGYTVLDLAFARAPTPTLWAVRSDGVLLGMTYVPEQQVYGWHQHTTDGFFESVAVIGEGDEDVLYAVIRRTVNGRSVRYIERLTTEILVGQENAFFVDSGLTYDGLPATTITGLYHLEGKSVQILADGAVHPERTVTNGAITLETSATTVQIGLGYNSDLQTLPLAFDGAPAGGQGFTKNINKVAMRVTNSSLVKAGPSFAKLTEYPARDVTDPYGSAPSLKTGELRFAVGPSWNSDGMICVRQDQPLPLTIMSMALDVATGG